MLTLKVWQPDCVVMLLGGTYPGPLYRVGIGWDSDLPFRPWPAKVTKTASAGFEDSCIAWFGVFVGVSWMDAHPIVIAHLKAISRATEAQEVLDAAWARTPGNTLEEKSVWLRDHVPEALLALEGPRDDDSEYVPALDGYDGC